MHPSLRLLTARLAPFSPTGLTGILTHPNPRPTLIALYNHTLTLLSRLPEHSVYRKSTENLTRHRLAIIESVKPAGYESYQTTFAAAKEQAGITTTKDTAFELGVVVAQARSILGDLARATGERSLSDYFNSETAKWALPGVEKKPVKAEVPEPGAMIQPGQKASVVEEWDEEVPMLPVEPELSEEQVEELEVRFGSGLIEEVIDQGWAEMKLVEQMESAKVWEELEVVPEEGQWEGFERKP